MLAKLNPQIEWHISHKPVDYAFAVEQMEIRAAAVAKGEASEYIWVLEHPHVYTMGTSARDQDILQARCPVVRTGRGGQITYHGPGQLIVYVILDLNKRGKDIRIYVQQLEQWVIETLAKMGISCQRRNGRVGLWVPRDDSLDDKIAAIGVRVKKWVTLHGLSININPDLSYYQGIVPCGITEHGVTSLSLLGWQGEMVDFQKSLQETFVKNPYLNMEFHRL
ncbi:MAG: lipoyl(octanoyl) transferase LipB [Alphaproteobacteria bacterium]|nr:lipoyl(octanoyl) transferase LipB [Alphaproteobacteria bacterium]